MISYSSAFLETTAQVETLNFDHVKRHALSEARTQDLEIVENDARRVCINTEYGLFSLEQDGQGARVTIRAPRRDWVQVLRDAFVAQISAVAPDAAARLRWSNCDPAGVRPSNMHLGLVQRIYPLGQAFLRIHLRLEDVTPFDDKAIHFRLLLPPSGLAAPEWPRVGPNGATVWPKGANALHCPVYTVREVDRDKGELVFDLFVHDGGRGTAWAKTAGPGDVVALLGPGGGGIPDVSGTILLYGDETAYPAMARILETLPAATSGHATLLCRSAAAHTYPMPAHHSIGMTWLPETTAETFAARILAEKEIAGPHFLWVASDKPSADIVRKSVRAEPGLTLNRYVAGYW